MAMVAPVRFSSGQKPDTEKRRSMAALPPVTSDPTTAVARALKWNSGSGFHRTSSAVRRQQTPTWVASAWW